MILEASINFSKFLTIITIDLVSVIPLVITILSYYRLSTFQALQSLSYQSSSRKSRATYNKDLMIRREEGSKKRDEDGIFQETQDQNNKVRRSKLKRLLERIGLYLESNLGAARMCMILIMLDILVFPLVIIHLVKPIYTNQEVDHKIQKGEREESRSVDEVYKAEIDTIFIRCSSGFDPIKKFMLMSSRIITKLLNGILTLICVVGIKSTFQRLTFTHRKDERKKALKGPDPERLSLDKITWDLYGNICQYLTVTDLANLSQVNRKLNQLTATDLYWEYQFKRDWIHKGTLSKASTTFKKECIYVYVNINLIAKHSRTKQLIPTQKDVNSTFRS